MNPPSDPQNDERPPLPGRPIEQSASSADDSDARVADGDTSVKTAEERLFEKLAVIEKFFPDDEADDFDVEAGWASLQGRLELATDLEHHIATNAFCDGLDDDEYQEFQVQRSAEVCPIPEAPETLTPELLAMLRDLLWRETQRILDKDNEGKRFSAPGLVSPAAPVKVVIYNVLEQLSGSTNIEPSKDEMYELVQMTAPLMFEDPSPVLDHQHALLRREANEATWRAEVAELRTLAAEERADAKRALEQAEDAEQQWLADGGRPEFGPANNPSPAEERRERAEQNLRRAIAAETRWQEPETQWQIPANATPTEALSIAVAQHLSYDQDGQRYPEPKPGSDPLGVIRNVVGSAIRDLPPVSLPDLADLVRDASAMIYDNPPDLGDGILQNVVEEVQHFHDLCLRSSAIEYVTIAEWYSAEPEPDDLSPEAAVQAQEIISGLSETQRDALQLSYDREAVAEAKRQIDELKLPPSNLKLLGDADIEAMPDLRWRIEGAMPFSGVGQFLAKTGEGKTYMMLDLAAHIAAGFTHWHGIPLHNDGKPLPVLYLAYESEDVFGGRLRAWKKVHEQSSHDVLFWFASESDEPLHLHTAAGRKALGVLMDQAGFGEDGGLIIADTQSVALAGLDENSNDEWNQMMDGLRPLVKGRNSVLAFVHHPGHGNDGRPRGNSSQLPSFDWMWRLSGKAGSKALDVKKVRGAPTGPLLNVGWTNDIEIGTSRSGAPVTERVFTPTAPKPQTIGEMRNDAFAYEDQVPELLQRYHDEHNEWARSKDDAARYIVDQIGGSLRKAKAALTDAKDAGTIVADRSSSGKVEWRPKA